jgi:hypothetical protein
MIDEHGKFGLQNYKNKEEIWNSKLEYVFPLVFLKSRLYIVDQYSAAY